MTHSGLRALPLSLLAACSINLSTADNESAEQPATTSGTEISTEPLAYLDCDFSDHAPDVLEAVWQVKAGNSIGTAFHIGDGQWLTAEHVVAGYSSVTLHHSGRSIRATVQARNTTGDTALLTTSSACGCP